MELESGTIFLAGLATFASPCVLPMIPIYLSVLMGGTLMGDEEITGKARMRLLFNGLAFILGFTLVFILLGLTATALGRFLLTNRLLFQQIGGLLVFMFGLKFLGWLHISILEREKRFQSGGGGSNSNLGPLGAFVMGLTFAFGWTPCIGPILGAILTYTAVSATGIMDGVWNLFLYAAGIGLPLLVVALLAHRGVGLLNKVKRFLPKIEKGTGVVLVAMGVLMVTDSTSILTFGVGEDEAAELGVEMAVEAESKMAGEASAAIASTDGVSGGEEVAGSCGGDGEHGGTVCDIEPAPAGAEYASNTDIGVSGEPKALYFHQPACPNCLKVAPIIAAMNETCSGKGLNVHKIDVSKGPNKALAAQRGVRGTPTLLFIDADGMEVSRLIGAVELAQVHDAIAVIMGEQCAEFTPL